MLFFWLSKVRDTSQGVPADPASDLGSHAYSGCVMVLVLAPLLPIARDGFSLEALLAERGGNYLSIYLSILWLPVSSKTSPEVRGCMLDEGYGDAEQAVYKDRDIKRQWECRG